MTRRATLAAVAWMAGAAAVFLGQTAAPTPKPTPTLAPPIRALPSKTPVAAAPTTPETTPAAATEEKASELPKCADCHEAQVKALRQQSARALAREAGGSGGGLLDLPR